MPNNSYLSRKLGGKEGTMDWRNYSLCTCCIFQRYLMDRMLFCGGSRRGPKVQMVSPIREVPEGERE